jgi:hypothetical protein
LEGEIDFGALVPLLPPGKPVVWEISPSRRSKSIREALAAWKERFPETLT